MKERDRLLHEGQLALDSGDSRKALRVLRQAHELDRDNPDIRLALAEALAEEGRLEQALRLLAEIADPGVEVLFALGDLQFENGQAQAALASYQRVLDQAPDEADAWVSIGLIHFQQDRPEQALVAYQRALELEPDSVFALNALGDARLATGDEAGAIAVYRQAIELDPDDGQAHLNLADALYDTGELEAAEAECRQALTCDPSLSQACLTLGNICLDSERSREAVQAFRQFLALEQGPESRQIRDEVKALLEGLEAK